MSQNHLRIVTVASLITCAMLTPNARAVDGKWNADAADNWGTASRWTNNQVADGIGAIANISYDITAARTITINMPVTVGRLRFEDATTSSHEWTLANSGGNVLTLQTSSGTPIIDAVNRTPTINAPIAGTQGLLKIGTGTLCLNAAANTYTGKTIATNGTLRINTGLSLGPVPDTLVADQITLSTGAVLMNNNSEPLIAANQGITLGAGGGKIQAGWSKPITINSPITGVGGLTINNDTTPGAISLNGDNTYTGPTVVGSSANNWAILLVNGSLNGSSAVNVTVNGWLGGNGVIKAPVSVAPGATLSAGARFQPGTLTVSNTVALTNCSLSFDLGSSTTEGGSVNDLLVVSGDVALSGTITLNVFPISGALAEGTYRLVNYTGSLLGGGKIVPAPSRYTLSVDTNTPGQINLVVTGSPGNLVWNGVGSSVWDLKGTANWLKAGSADVFLQGDNVVFDDTGSYIFNINMAPAFDSSIVTLVPGSVSITTSNDLTITSVDTTYGGRLSGPMALYKGGSGTLTLGNGNTSMPNYYDGPTIITNGILKVGHARALGTITGPTYATNGGTLDVNAQNIGFEPVVIQGTGKGGSGALVNNGADQQNALRVLTLAGDATVGGSGRFDLRGSTGDTFLKTGGEPFKLTKRGPQQFSLVGVTVDPALGDIDILEGTMSYEAGTTSLGNPTNKVTVAAEAQLLFWGASNPLDKVLEFNGGARDNLYAGSGTNTIVGPVTVNADSRWNIGGTSVAVYSSIVGSGGIIKSGGSPLYLYGANTYTGNTIINAGQIVLGANSSLAKSSQIAIGSGATLDASAVAGGLTLASGQTLLGSGTLQGSLNVPAGATVAPGMSVGTLTVSGDLTLTDAAAVFELGSDVTTGNDLLKANSISASGVTSIKIVPQAPLDSVNAYNLLQITGNVMPPGTETHFSVTSDTRYGFTLLPTDASGGGFLQLKVSGTGAPANLLWAGNDSANPTWWDTKVTTNWVGAGTSGEAFYTSDSVKFDDTATGTTVDLIGTVQPGLLALANNTKPFRFAGSGSLQASALTADGSAATTFANTGANTFVFGVTNNNGSLAFNNTGLNNFGSGVTLNGGSVILANGDGNNLGAVNINSGTLAVNNNGLNTFGSPVIVNGTLTFDQGIATTFGSALTGSGQVVKKGPNTLTLNAASASFTGTIQANSGILRVGNGTALGDTAGTTTIANGAGFDVNGQTLGFESMVVSGAGPDGLGAIVNRGAAQQNAFRKITLAGNTTFGAPLNRWDIRSDDVASPNGILSTDGNPYNLTKLGPAEVWIVSTTVDPALGDVDIFQGTLGYENMSTGLGNPARTLTIYPNATLGFYNSANPLDKHIVIKNGGRVSASNSARNAIAGPIAIPEGVGIFDISSGVTLISSNEISGAGVLLKQNTGTLILNATNTLTGDITVNGGTLAISNSLALGSNKVVAVNYTTATTGGGGVRLSLRGGITPPEDVIATFTAVVTNGMDLRCSIASEAFTNVWAGPILLNGNNIVGFYGAPANPLDITGPIYGTNGFTGTAFFRGAAGVCGTVQNVLNAPVGIMNITDNSVWRFDKQNTWARTAISYGRMVLGTDNAATPTAELVLGQSGTSSGTLDLNGHNQTVPSITTINGNNHWIGNSSTTADSLFTFNGGAGVSSLDGHIVDSVSGGTRKVAVTIQAGTLTLLATNGYTGNTIVSGGTLAIGANGTIPTTPVVELKSGAVLDTSAKTAGLTLASGQTLIGLGTVNGSITAGNGATLSLGASIGTFTVRNSLTLQAGSTNVFELDKSATPNSDLVIAGSVTYGGRLVLVNLGPNFAIGDSFKLFSATTYSGTFAEIVPAAPGTGMLWDTSKLNVDGTLGVKSDLPTTPTTLNVSYSGNTITLSWPPEYTGWSLLAQTNNITVGLSTTWFPVPGSTTTNQVSFTVDPAQPTVFYRLSTP